MTTREFVALAGTAAELAGVALIAGGLMLASVRTVAFTPTLDNVFVLTVIVAIRTFLSWSLALELEERWPWQRSLNPKPS